MNTNMKAFLEGLRGDLEREYSAAIQYINHASLLEGVEFYPLIAEMKVHAEEEMHHAIVLADLLTYFQGDVTTSVYEVLTSDDSLEMVVQDMEYEMDAILRYRERIQQARDLNLEETTSLLKNILSEEYEHLSDLEVVAPNLKGDLKDRYQKLQDKKV